MAADVTIDTSVPHDVCGNGPAGLNDGDCASATYSAADLQNKTVEITGAGVVGSNVYGAHNDSTDNGIAVTGNIVTINSNPGPGNTVVGGTVYGGRSESNGTASAVSDNKVFINSDGTAGNVYGGMSQDNTTGNTQAESNQVEIERAKVSNEVVGGVARSNAGAATVTGNRVTVRGSTVQSWVDGGDAISNSGDATASDNHATLENGSTAGIVAGAYVSGANAATATGNTITVTDSKVTGDVYGSTVTSYSGDATASSNIVTLTNSTAQDNVYGGYADSNGSGMSGKAVNNKVVISGGQISGNIYGGCSLIDGLGETGSATGNSVTLSGAPILANSSLYGGFVGWNGIPEPGTDAFTGNTLNLQTSGLTVANVYNFEKLNFFLPSTLTAGSTLLTVTGTADLTDGAGRSSIVNVGIDGASSPLKKGDQVILIDASAGTLVTNPGLNTTANGQGMQGVTLKYEFDINTTADQLVAKVTQAGATEESKSLSEGYLSSTAFLTQASDFLTHQGVSAAQEEVKNARLAQGREFSSFIALSGGKVRNETGSHIDVSGYHLLVGLASAQKLHNSELTLAGFIEYGEGDYTSHNSFNSGKIKGKGDTRYQGIGLLARNEYPSGLYLDASLRIGQTNTDFKANLGQATKFDTKSTYTGAHLGIGKNWTLNEIGTLDTYGQILYTRQQSDSVTLNTGEKVKFESIGSERVRIGTRYQHKLTNALSGYAGVAYDHEFGGKAKAKTNGYKIDAPSLKGGSGMFEIGLTGKPAANKPLFLDLGIQGYAGKREGVTGSLRVNYYF